MTNMCRAECKTLLIHSLTSLCYTSYEEEEEEDFAYTEVHCVEAHPLCGTLSWRG